MISHIQTSSGLKISFGLVLETWRVPVESGDAEGKGMCTRLCVNLNCARCGCSLYL